MSVVSPPLSPYLLPPPYLFMPFVATFNRIKDKATQNLLGIDFNQAPKQLWPNCFCSCASSAFAFVFTLAWASFLLAFVSSRTLELQSMARQWEKAVINKVNGQGTSATCVAPVQTCFWCASLSFLSLSLPLSLSLSPSLLGVFVSRFGTKLKLPATWAQHNAYALHKCPRLLAVPTRKFIMTTISSIRQVLWQEAYILNNILTCYSTFSYIAHCLATQNLHLSAFPFLSSPLALSRLIAITQSLLFALPWLHLFGHFY